MGIVALLVERLLVPLVVAAVRYGTCVFLVSQEMGQKDKDTLGWPVLVGVFVRIH